MKQRFHRMFGLVSCLCALLLASATYFSVSHKGHADVRAGATAESRLIVEITNGFVRTYSEYQARYAKGQLPNPALYRADSLQRVDQGVLDRGGATSVIGLPGRAISKSATDEHMRQQMIKLADEPLTDVLESVYLQGGKSTHRTLWPFFASEPECADCHNRLQNLTGDQRWQVGDLMGAQYVDQNISPQLGKVTHTARLFAILVFLIVVAVSYCCLFLYKQYQLGSELKLLATTDSMTGCINRREMYERIKRLTGHANGALLMLDLDRFKRINDTYGHAVGDSVIKDFTVRIKGVLRSDDWVARVGGEEFVVWLPNVKPTTALLIAERLRESVDSSSLELDEATINYTVSIGLHVVKNALPSRIDSWIKSADAHLYKAKSEGRNRVVFEKELMV